MESAVVSGEVLRELQLIQILTKKQPTIKTDLVIGICFVIRVQGVQQAVNYTFLLQFITYWFCGKKKTPAMANRGFATMSILEQQVICHRLRGL